MSKACAKTSFNAIIQYALCREQDGGTHVKQGPASGRGHKQWKVLQLQDIPRTTISWHPRTGNKQNQKRSAGARGWVNPFKKERIFAAHCQTLQTWPLYVWSLRKAKGSAWLISEQNEILHCLNIISSKYQELTQTRLVLSQLHTHRLTLRLVY